MQFNTISAADYVINCPAADEEKYVVRSGYYDIKVTRFTSGYWGVVRSSTVRIAEYSSYELDLNDVSLNPSGGGQSYAGYSLRCLAIE